MRTACELPLLKTRLNTVASGAQPIVYTVYTMIAGLRVDLERASPIRERESIGRTF